MSIKVKPNHKNETPPNKLSYMHRKFNILIRRDLTLSTREVLMYQGETELTRMLSLAHSHAKFFVIWFIAPDTYK